jgi:hypothetical protein
MLRLDDCNNITTKDLKNFGSGILIHEHDFEPIKIKEGQKLIICLICGLLYCEKCGKTLASTITANDKTDYCHSNSQSIMM